VRNIKIIAIGKIKQTAKYLEPGIALYQKRIERHTPLQWVELPEEVPTATVPVEKIKAREAEAILKHCTDAERIVLLSERGKYHNSEAFARWLFYGHPQSEYPLNGGPGPTRSERIIFIIGGAFGTADALAQRATDQIALSALTFPHQMVRLILVEQLYRAFTLLNGEPYHK